MIDPTRHTADFDPGEPPEYDFDDWKNPTTKYTTGPWERDGLIIYRLMWTGQYRKGVPTYANRFSVQIQRDHKSMPAEELEATASLIQAAPDTYEALKGLARLLDDTAEDGELDGEMDGELRRAIQAARLAINKAEGRR